MKAKTGYLKFISVLLILIIFTGLGCVGDQAENGNKNLVENTSGNVSAGKGEILTIFHAGSLSVPLRSLKPSLKPSIRALMFNGKLRAVHRV